MAALNASELQPLEWLKLRNPHTLIVEGDEIRCCRVTGSGVKLVYAGPIAEAEGQLPRRADWIAAMPAGRCIHRHLTAPVSSVRQAQTVLPGLMDVDLPIPLDQSAYGFPALWKNGDHIEAIGVAVRDQDLQEHIATCNSAGADPLLLDHEGLALWTQSLHELRPEKKSAAPPAVAWCGDQHTVLVFGKDKRMTGSQVIRLAAGEPDFEARLLRAVQAQGQSVDAIDWRLAGPKAATATWPGNARVHNEPELFIDRAIARRAQHAGPMRCNLRTDHPRFSAGKSRLSSNLLIHLAILTALLWGAALGGRAWMEARDTKAQAALTQASEDLIGYSVKGQELDEVQRVLGEEVSGDASAVLGSAAASTQLNKMLDFARRNDLSLFNLRLEDGTLECQGRLIFPITERLPLLGMYEPQFSQQGTDFTLRLTLP